MTRYNDDGHWWDDPFGLTKILRDQGVLDGDEFIIEEEKEPSRMKLDIISRRTAQKEVARCRWHEFRYLWFLPGKIWLRGTSKAKLHAAGIKIEATKSIRGARYYLVDDAAFKRYLAGDVEE